MEKIVYLLGAGFSAPLGIPLMGNFIVKSKNMIDADPKKYQYIAEIVDEFDLLSKTKNYYHSNLFNIEEVLSILEMSRVIQNEIDLFKTMLGDPEEKLLRYIKDVVRYYTPKFKPYKGKMPSNFHQLLFGKENPYEDYCYFIASLFQLSFHRNDTIASPNGSYQHCIDKDIQYCVVSLNYDMVLETVAQFLSDNCDDDIYFRKENNVTNVWSQIPYLSKIHGSVDSDIIVTPTWNKQLEDKVISLWGTAYTILSSANQIRIIGYSLPESDAYVKYLLKAAAIKSRNLKNIDVICMDNDSSDVENRYKNFISLVGSSFKNIAVQAYFSKIAQLTTSETTKEVMNFDKLEIAHRQFFNR